MKRYCAVLLLGLFLVAANGCCVKQTASEPAQAKQEPVQEETTVQKVEEPQEVPPTAMELYDEQYSRLPLQHTVEKGECLWWIAEYKKIYNDPFMWPLIYKANQDKINDPDLIYPGQVFYIPRTFDLVNLKESRRSAGAPRPYLPPQDANVPTQLREELGWGF